MLTNLPQWKALEEHYQHIATQRMQDWFANDSERFQRFSLEHANILLDYSKNRIQPQTLTLLCELANAVGLKNKIQHLFAGEKINVTEQRCVQHMALRDSATHSLTAHPGRMQEIVQTRARLQQFVDDVRSGHWCGSNGQKIKSIVTIGIGGSHLGPQLTTKALEHVSNSTLSCFFIANVDPTQLQQVLTQIDPETTLFIISSKTFTTIETLTNAKAVRAFMKSKVTDISKHFVAVTSATEQAIHFGINEEMIFPMWDWVGGRYSVWSAIGLPLMLMIGNQRFEEFLAGAHAMDKHFVEADFSQNMPVILGLLGLWYVNFFNATSHAIIPYCEKLSLLPAYCQQADMESNGKSVTVSGEEIPYNTGPIIWGDVGCNSQHSFHQLLHQGRHLTPVDFILVNTDTAFEEHQNILVSSALSQAQALMQGKSYVEAYSELIADGVSADEASFLAKHKTIIGNKPSNILFLQELTPFTLGALLALYEHKIFVQGVLWDINSFDQWGVELGKKLLPKISADLEDQVASDSEARVPGHHDSSTAGLINYYQRLKEFA